MVRVFDLVEWLVEQARKTAAEQSPGPDWITGIGGAEIIPFPGKWHPG